MAAILQTVTRLMTLLRSQVSKQICVQIYAEFYTMSHKNMTLDIRYICLFCYF